MAMSGIIRKPVQRIMYNLKNIFFEFRFFCGVIEDYSFVNMTDFLIFVLFKFSVFSQILDPVTNQ